MSKQITSFTPEDFEREYDLEGREVVPHPGAINALRRSVGVLSQVEILPAERPAYERADHLERDGSQFILISMALLENWGCPVDARDFVMHLEGVANGNYTDLLPFTDEQLSLITGLHTETIREKRKALMAWEEKTKCSLIEIVEREFNREKGKTDPTQYRVTFIRDVASFIRDARHNKAFARNPVRAIENAETNGLLPMIQTLRDDLPPAKVRRRKRAELKPPTSDKVIMARRARESMFRIAETWSDLQAELGEFNKVDNDSLLDGLSSVIASAPQRLEDRMRKVAGRRQSGD